MPLVTSEKMSPAGEAVNVPVTGPPTTLLMPIVAEPELQNVPPVSVSVGDGFTVMVKVIGRPGQLTSPCVKTGVTVMVPEIGVEPGFCAIKEGMFPVPLAPRPM